jgi:VanZ family protein
MGRETTGRLAHFPFWRACGWGLVVLVIYLSLTPAPPDLPGEEGDKVGHTLAYGVLMVWFAWLYPGPRARAAHALGFVVLGVALEFAQRSTGYRTFDTLDMLADATGVALGWLAALLPTPTGPQMLESMLRRSVGRPGR